jgi:hypothetical protein
VGMAPINISMPRTIRMVSTWLSLLKYGKRCHTLLWPWRAAGNLTT